MVELCVDRLSVSVGGALDEDGHHPRRERCSGVPLKSFSSEVEPGRSVKGYDKERTGPRGQHTKAREEIP
jgi:hypothetical protein